MTEPLKPFDREEAFQIYLKLIELSGGKDIGSLLEFAINLAQEFQTKVPTNLQSFTLPATNPLKINGSFGAIGKCLYFVQDNGNETFIWEYPEPAPALGMAIALNSIGSQDV